MRFTFDTNDLGCRSSNKWHQYGLKVTKNIIQATSWQGCPRAASRWQAGGNLVARGGKRGKRRDSIGQDRASVRKGSLRRKSLTFNGENIKRTFYENRTRTEF